MTDMTDREMLIAAAKAGGEIPPKMYDNDQYIWDVLARWNPRENSLQAFRLAARLKLQVSFGTFKDNTALVYQFGKPSVEVEVENTDIESAAREAIFLMAVQIGKGDEMTDIPFIAVGAGELGEPADEILCPHCNNMHPIQYGTSQTLLTDGTLSEPKPCRLIGSYKCGGKVYLATINRKLIK